MEMRSDFIFKYKNRCYTSRQIERMIDNLSDMQNQLSNMDLIICESCGKVVEKDEICNEHCSIPICKSCCEECQKESAFIDYIDSIIDEMRGK